MGERAGRKHRFPRKQLKVPFVYEGGTIACILDYVSLWFVLQRGESRIAIRSCFDPQGIDSARVITSGKNDCRFVVEGRTGRFAIHLQVLKEEREILHYKTELTPHRTVRSRHATLSLREQGRTRTSMAKFTSRRKGLLLLSHTLPFAILSESHFSE